MAFHQFNRAIVFSFVSILAIYAAPATAQQKLRWKLEPVWESSAGHHSSESIHSFSDDGKVAFFISGNRKKIIARNTTDWRPSKRRPTKPIELKNRIAQEIVMTRDGKLGAQTLLVYVKGVARSSQIRFFDRQTDKTLATVDAHSVYMKPVLAFSRDGKMLASASVDGIYLWNAQSYRKIRFIKNQQSHRPGGMVFSPDGKTLVANNWGQVEFFDVATGKRKSGLGGHIAQVWNLAVSPDGKQIVSVGNDPQLLFWDPKTGINIGRVPLDTAHLVAPVRFSPDGKRIAVGDRKIVRIFDAKTHKLVLQLRGHTSNVQTLAFRPDGKQLASGSGGITWIDDSPHADHGEFILWDLAKARPMHTIRSHQNGVFQLAYTPDGKKVFTAGSSPGFGKAVNPKSNEHKRAIGVWSSETGRHLKWIDVERGFTVNAMAISPDGKVLAHNAVDGSQIQLLDTKTGKEIRKIHARNTPSALTFSPDGKRIAAVGSAGGFDSGKGFIQILDAQTGKSMAFKIAHKQTANCVAFAPDGESLVTGGNGSEIWKWRLVELGK